MTDCLRTLTVSQTGGLFLSELEPGQDLLLHLQRQVGGDVELKMIRPDLHLWVHETGRFNYDRNPILEDVARHLEWPPPIFGPGVFTGGADGDGDTESLTDGQIKLLLTLLAGAHQLSDITG